MRRPKPTMAFFALLGGLLLLDLILPIASLVIHTGGSIWTGIWQDPGASRALTVSVATSTTAVLVMTLLGVPLGYVLARAELPFRRLWIALVFLPMVVPDLAGGILLLQTYGPYGTLGQPLSNLNVLLTNNLAGIVLAQLFVAAPFVIVSALAGFASVDSELEMAAATLGDSRWHIFRRISLPLAWPSIAAGITFAWIRALGEFGATLIVAYNPYSLPVYMWVKFESTGLAGSLPIAFLLVVMAGAAVAVSMFASRLTGLADVASVLQERPAR